VFLLSVGKSQIRIRNRSVLYTVLQVVLFLALSNPFFRGGYYLRPSFAQEFAVLLLRLRWGIVRLRRNWLKSFHRICPLLCIGLVVFHQILQILYSLCIPQTGYLEFLRVYGPGILKHLLFPDWGFSSLWSFSFLFNLGGIAPSVL